MKIVVFGNKSSTQRLCDYLAKSPYPVSSLVTLSEKQKAKIDISGASNELIECAHKNNIDVYNPSSYKILDAQDEDWFEKQSFDIGLCVGWQRIIPSNILRSIKNGVFGWHGSGFEFPNGRGRSPINWTIRLGINKVFHNCFRYDIGVDDGQIFDTKLIKINDKDYISDVLESAFLHIQSSSLELLKCLETDSLRLAQQPKHAFVTLPKLTEDDGLIQPVTMSCGTAINIVRSCSRPFPGAYLKLFSGEKLRIWRMREIKGKISSFSDLKIGELVRVNDVVKLKFKDGMCEITEFDYTKAHLKEEFVTSSN